MTRHSKFKKNFTTIIFLFHHFGFCMSTWRVKKQKFKKAWNWTQKKKKITPHANNPLNHLKPDKSHPDPSLSLYVSIVPTTTELSTWTVCATRKSRPVWHLRPHLSKWPPRSPSPVAQLSALAPSPKFSWLRKSPSLLFKQNKQNPKIPELLFSFLLFFSMHFYNLVPIFFLSLSLPTTATKSTLMTHASIQKKRKRENETKSQNIISHFCTPYMQMIIFLLGWGKEGKVTKRVDWFSLFYFFFLSPSFLRFPLL